MELSHITNSLPVTLGIPISVYLAYFKLTTMHKRQYKNDFLQVKRFFAQTAKSNTHALALETAFRAFVGKPYNLDEINVLLSARYPLSTILQYAKCRHLLYLNQTSNTFVYKEKYDTEAKRKKERFSWWVLYAITSPLFAAIIFYFGVLAAKVDILNIAMVWLASGILALWSLKEIQAFSMAKKLLNNIQSTR